MNLFRRLPRSVALSALTLGVALLLPAAASAISSVSHIPLTTFGAKVNPSPTPENPYPLSGPIEVAVDQSSHDIYVTDPGNHRVEKFTASGEFILMFGKEVNKGKVESAHASEPEENVCTAHEECQAGAESFTRGGLESPRSLAVDNAPGGEGDVYVCDIYDSLQKFDSSGYIVSTWAEAGQLSNGCPNDDIDVGPTGNLYAGTGNGVTIYNRAGTFLSAHGSPPYYQEIGHVLRVDSEGNAYATTGNPYGEPERGEGIYEVFASGAHSEHGLATPGEGVAGNFTYGLAFDPSNDDFYQDTGTEINHYIGACKRACEPTDSSGAGELTGARGVAVDGTSHTVYVANTGADDVAVFVDVQPKATTGPAEEIAETTATLTGHVEPANYEDKPVTECYFEYGLTATYGNTVPCEEPAPSSGAPFTTVTAVHATISGLPSITGLPANTHYHYRLVTVNSSGGTGLGSDRTFRTTEPPTFGGVSSLNVTATTADLHATIDPNGLETKYHFEYGTTTSYGQSTPVTEIAGEPEALFAFHSVTIHLEDLQHGVTYHFRLVAENALDTGDPVTSEDQSFEFLPPACPNSAVRQQTGASFLPDCRAYELVSPGNANGTLLYPGGPNTGQATSPSRFAYVGAFSSLPGENVIGTIGDLYVATRTDTGWFSHYIGPSGSEAGCVGDPPNEPWSRELTTPVKVQDQVPTDPTMSRFLDFSLGAPDLCIATQSGTSDATNPIDLPSNVAYMWSAEGSPLGKLPTDLATVPHAAAALDCPADVQSPYGDPALCLSEASASADLSHFVFSSNRLAFAPGGLAEAPGSAYDDNLATGAVTLISKLMNGQPIPQDPTFASVPANESGHFRGGKEEFIRFPAVSTDGSHILMSTATAPTPQCDNEHVPPPCTRFTETPIHLYMSVGDALAKEISVNETTHQNVAVNYVGMTPDGSKVYFTSEEHLTGEDEGHGGDSLFMWSEKGEEEGHPLTLISKADLGSPPGAGDTGDCNPAPILTSTYFSGEIELPWTSSCGVRPYSGWAYAQAPGGRGGNAVSDSAIAANGDIYFFSPEQLDGDRGVLNQENLYDYREGRLHFVATFAPERACVPSGFEKDHQCSVGPIARIEVNPTDTRMAFVTPDQVTSYDNTDTTGSCQNDLLGHPTGETHCTEMYSYTPATGQIVCDSCNPEGRPPTSDVYASQDGLFMTNDGRTFFSTEEALVPQDTNAGPDVYEFVDGRPHLITSGTGTASFGGENLTAPEQKPGLVGVSANGTDVYFSTFDALTSEDHNGDFLKFYDARTDGGFPQAPPRQPCDSSEECHGPTAEAPQLPAPGAAATLSGGNANPASLRHHKKHHKRAKHKRHGHRAKVQRRAIR